jgi:glutamate-ammonia-ligase adenylyltransferase
MRDHLGSAEGSEEFNIKQDAGGIVDIEFAVQYLVLKHAKDSPALYEFTDNVRVIDALAGGGYLSESQAEVLRESYKTYRALGHRQTLQNAKGLISSADLIDLRQSVKDVWQSIFKQRA